MNLHLMVRGLIGSINPDISATLKRSTGYTTGTDGTRVPAYTTLTGMIQVQGINNSDLVHVNNLNQAAVLRSVWLHGNWAGVIRTDETGGDLLEFPMVPGGAVKTWKITTVKESWPDWTSVIVALQ
ncbi:MAG: hypothetical protein WC714_28360 [Candidatus Obscuribacterales bacterium]|jgi:hypothetical protein